MNPYGRPADTVPLGLRLRALRLTHNRSVRSLAAALHVTPPTIYQWEVRADVTGLPNLFAQSPRYRWRFIACGVAVTYRTDAAGLRLSGRVVQRRTVSSIITLVQLVSADGLVVASVRAVPSETIRQMVITSTYNQIDDISRHVYPPGVCWCTPVAGPLDHVNEDGSPC